MESLLSNFSSEKLVGYGARPRVHRRRGMGRSPITNPSGYGAEPRKKQRAKNAKTPSYRGRTGRRNMDNSVKLSYALLRALATTAKAPALRITAAIINRVKELSLVTWEVD